MSQKEKNSELASSEIGLYSKTMGGHRADYYKFVRSKFGGERVSGSEIFKKKQAVLFLMIEEGFFFYVVCAVVRLLLRRKTVGLLFRPIPVIQGRSLKMKIKKITLRLLKGCASVRTLSIVPVAVDNRINGIVDDWVYDFQLWDIKSGYLGNTCYEVEDIVFSVKNYALGKKIIVALGSQTRGKGVEILADAMESGGLDGWCVVVAGKFSEEMICQKEAISRNGGLVFDRFITNEEMLALYSIADLAWCFYSPEYDQASGILGRALQFSVTPVVRKGSVSEWFCASERMPHIASIDAIGLGGVIGEYELKKTSRRALEASFERFARVSCEKINYSLGKGPEKAE